MKSFECWLKFAELLVEMSDQAALDILGLKQMPDQAELKRAYRTASMNSHPDRGGSNQDFNRVRAAYERLLSASSRPWYEHPPDAPFMPKDRPQRQPDGSVNMQDVWGDWGAERTANKELARNFIARYGQNLLRKNHKYPITITRFQAHEDEDHSTELYWTAELSFPVIPESIDLAMRVARFVIQDLGQDGIQLNPYNKSGFRNRMLVIVVDGWDFIDLSNPRKLDYQITDKNAYWNDLDYVYERIQDEMRSSRIKFVQVQNSISRV